MTQNSYKLLEDYMLSCMGDSAHDKEHVYRVLYTALEIAEAERKAGTDEEELQRNAGIGDMPCMHNATARNVGIDIDILITACLLHDIGRKEQFENPTLCHAQVGAKKAYAFLLKNGFAEDFAKEVRDCVETHRYRKSNPPKSIEAKILFDADKLDVTGAIGIARTLVYKGRVEEALYSLDDRGQVSDGRGDKVPSFFQEYKYKLENIYDRFYTAKGAELAKERQAAATAFYESMLREVRRSYQGKEKLGVYVE